MALDVYFTHDIQRAITSIALAQLTTAQAHGVNVEFIDGALATHRAYALAFGIPWSEVDRELPAGWVGLEAGDG